MRLATALVFASLLSLSLTGCKEDQKQQLARCELEARHVYPYPGRQQDGEFQDFVFACMKANGYEIYEEGNSCPKVFFSHSLELALNDGCYKPSGFWGNLFFKLGT